MDLAKGKYIYFLDSDDEITDYAIEHLVKLAEKQCGNGFGAECLHQ
jgi:hypothetical protein